MNDVITLITATVLIVTLTIVTHDHIECIRFGTDLICTERAP